MSTPFDKLMGSLGSPEPEPIVSGGSAFDSLMSSLGDSPELAESPASRTNYAKFDAFIGGLKQQGETEKRRRVQVADQAARQAQIERASNLNEQKNRQATIRNLSAIRQRAIAEGVDPGPVENKINELGREVNDLQRADAGYAPTTAGPVTKPVAPRGVVDHLAESVQGLLAAGGVPTDYEELKRRIGSLPAIGPLIRLGLEGGDAEKITKDILEHPIENLPPGLREIAGGVKGQVEQLRKAKEVAGTPGSSAIEVLGHVGAGLLPLYGPQAGAIGEAIGEERYGSALGQGVGLVASELGTRGLIPGTRPAPGQLAGAQKGRVTNIPGDETIGAKTYADKIEPAQPGRQAAVSQTEAPTRPAQAEKVIDPYAYRVRDVGEQGLTAREKAQAGADEATVRGYKESRGEVQGKPQELTRIDLKKLDPADYEIVESGGIRNVRFKKNIPESLIEKEGPEGFASKSEREVAAAVSMEARLAREAEQLEREGLVIAGPEDLGIPKGGRELPPARPGTLKAGEELGIERPTGIPAEQYRSGVATKQIGQVPESPVSISKGQAAPVVPKTSSRQTPKTLAKGGFGAADDLVYEITGERQAAELGRANLQKRGTEGSIQYLKDAEFNAEYTGTALATIRQLQDSGKFAQVDQVINLLSEKATAAGQGNNAIKAVALFAPERAVVFARKRAKEAGRTLTPKQIESITEIAKSNETLRKSIGTLEGRIRELEQVSQGKTAGRPLRVRQFGQSNKIISVQAKDAAIARIKTRSEGAEAGFIGERPVPEGVDLSATGTLKDYGTVAAFYLEGGARSVAELSAHLLNDFGEKIKPYLEQIQEEGFRLLREQRAEKRFESRSVIRERTAIDEIGERISQKNQAARKAELQTKAAEKKIQATEARNRRTVEQIQESIKRKEVTEEARTILREERDLLAQERQADLFEAGYENRQKQYAKRQVEKADKAQRRELERDRLAVAKIQERLYREGEAETARQRVVAEREKVIQERAVESIQQEFRKQAEREAAFELKQAAKTLESQKKLAEKAALKLAREIEKVTPGAYIARRVGDVLSAARSVRTGGELSSTLRQGGFFAPSHPLVTAKAFGRQLKAVFSKKATYKAYEEAFDARPIVQEWKKHGVEFTKVHSSDLLKHEEPFRSEIAKKIPGIVHTEQGYSAMLNEQRLGVAEAHGRWLKFLDGKLGLKVTDADYQAVARLINDGTGRGTLGKTTGPLRGIGAAERSVIVRHGFFAYRWLKSRANLMNPVYYAKLPPAARLIAAKEALHFAGATMATLWLAGKLGAEVDKDPESPDFLKIRIGEQHYETPGGYSGLARAIVRSAIHSLGRTKGTLVKKGDRWLDTETGKTHAGPSEFGLDFLRTKLAPAPGVAVDLLSGETLERDEAGKKLPPTLGRELSQLGEPLIIENMRKAYTRGGVSGMAWTLPEVLGVSTLQYETRPGQAGGKPLSPAAEVLYDQATKARYQAIQKLEAQAEFKTLTEGQKEKAREFLGGQFAGTTNDKLLGKTKADLERSQRNLDSLIRLAIARGKKTK